MSPVQLADIEAFLRQEIEPQAEVIDQSSEALFHAFQQMGMRNFLALKVPINVGGAGWNQSTYAQFQRLIARYSGTLAFLQTQHQSAASMIAVSPNLFLKQSLLPSIIKGHHGMGVGFSQLRRQGPPMVSAKPVMGKCKISGYEISGTVPWVTGLGCFQSFIIGAELPNQDVIFGVVPLDSITHADGGRIEIQSPLSLVSMNATQTVEVSLSQWQLGLEQVVAIHSAGWIHDNDRSKSLHHGFFALGCAQASLHLIEKISRQRFARITAVSAAIDQLRADYNACDDLMFSRLDVTDLPMTLGLEAKASAIKLAVRCAHAAIVISGGAANLQDHPAQRLYREALALSVFGQTLQSMTATLQQIAGLGIE